MEENISITLFSEREQCELAEKRIWGWKEREQVMRPYKNNTGGG